GDEMIRRLESWVYLQVIDKAWKNHLQAMDALQDSVRLRSYGQRDPLQEYKREAFNLFQQLYARVEEETTTSLVAIEIPDQPEIQAPARAEPKEEQLSYRHPDAASSYSPQTAAPAAGGNGQDDGMIYHGSRSAQAAPRAQAPQQPQTFKREDPKVGRND